MHHQSHESKKKSPLSPSPFSPQRPLVSIDLDRPVEQGEADAERLQRAHGVAEVQRVALAARLAELEHACSIWVELYVWWWCDGVSGSWYVSQSRSLACLLSLFHTALHPSVVRTVLGPGALPVLNAHEEVLGGRRQHPALVEAQHQALQLCIVLSCVVLDRWGLNAKGVCLSW
jgi:hypothetical protein